MNQSVSFDRAASFYDQTRDFPEPVAIHGIQAILDIAGLGARILDVGTGTGRVSVPLLERGANLIGCDLSTKMMAMLRQKFPLARLTQADASQLPFPTDYFDAITTCHVMHLVGPWREALREYRRVLKPGGVYINAKTDHLEGESINDKVRNHWRSQVAAYGIKSNRPGVKNDQELRDELLAMGAKIEKVEVVRFPRIYIIREIIASTAQRAYSHTWDIPDEVLSASLEELKAWATQEFGDLDKKYEEPVCFVLDVAQY